MPIVLEPKMSKMPLVSKLVNLMKDRAGSSRGPDGGLTKYVEMGGLPISLTFPMIEYLTGTTGCQYVEKCLINQDQDCRITRAIYRIICKTCEDKDGTKFVYLGTTGFSIHKRMLEHAYSARPKNIKNALGKHTALHHVGGNDDDGVIGDDCGDDGGGDCAGGDGASGGGDGGVIGDGCGDDGGGDCAGGDNASGGGD